MWRTGDQAKALERVGVMVTYHDPQHYKDFEHDGIQYFNPGSTLMLAFDDCAWYHAPRAKPRF